MKRLKTFLFGLDFHFIYFNLLFCALIFSSVPAAAAGTYFIEAQPPVEFSDCKPTDWYYENVRLCQQVGLMIGSGEHFEPLARLSQAEAIILAARLHMVYNGGALPVADNSTDWFRPYEKYAITNNLIDENMNFAITTPSNRGEFISLVLRAVPDTQFPTINTITNIPDVDSNTKMGSGVLLLYNAGVLTGLNEYGYFQADSPISRAEVAAILCRVIRPETRIKFQLLPSQETSVQVAALPEVFQSLYITDFNGSVITATRSSESEHALFDLSGTQLIPFQKGVILAESDGIFQVNRGYYGEGNSDKVVYFTAEGQQLNDNEFDRGTSFVGGFAFVQNMSGEQYGSIFQLDTSGKVVKTFDNQDGHRIFRNLTGRYCLLFHDASHAHYILDSVTGKIEAFPYSSPNTISDGRIQITAKNYQVGYLTEDLSMIIEPRYSSGGNFHNGLAVVYEEGRYGAIDKNGNLILPTKYKSLGNFNSSGLAIAQVQTGEKWIYCVIDTGGNVYSILDQEQTVATPYKLYDSYISYQTVAGYQILNWEGTLLANGLVGQRIIPSQNQVIVQKSVDNGKYMYYIVAPKS